MTTPRISHYLLDAVVSVYSKEGNNPWTEIRAAIDGAAQAAAQLVVNMTSAPVSIGTNDKIRNAENKNHVKFKEADVISNLAFITQQR